MACRATGADAACDFQRGKPLLQTVKPRSEHEKPAGIESTRRAALGGSVHELAASGGTETFSLFRRLEPSESSLGFALLAACRFDTRLKTGDARQDQQIQFIPEAPLRRSSPAALRDEQAAHVRGFRFGLGPSLRTKVLDQGEHDEDQHDDPEEPADRHSAHHFQPRRSRPLCFSSSSIPRKRSRDRVLAGCDRCATGASVHQGHEFDPFLN
jgi:hypothetical protein